MSKQKIVVVEDEPDILEMLTYNLKREGFAVKSSMDGLKGLALIRQERPDLVLLDLMLPGMSGLSICEQLQSDPETAHIAVIMVTAKSEEGDVVAGLGAGADDYISKPFSPKELVARIKAVLRRPAPESCASRERIEIAGLVIDSERFEVLLNQNSIKLTATEFRLLHRLASRPGRVFSREQLIDQSLGSDSVVVDRNIDVHVRAIRKKLLRHQGMIETVRGIGYRFNAAALQ